MAPIDVKVQILRKCREEERNFYLIQSKNPYGFKEVESEFPRNIIIGTTIETNRKDLCKAVSNAPEPYWRVRGMLLFRRYLEMISVEPKMDCDPDVLASWIRAIGPNFVSIGADSGNNNLVEPTPNRVQDLIERIERHTLVLTKANLGRIMSSGV